MRWARLKMHQERAQYLSKCFGSSMRPLKLRREPDEFWTEPRKSSAKVTLPKLKCLEKSDEA